ncbi:uncharacterized protein C6orf118-like [Denticeps clupeoides]|uniref:uncharacterized protein C6orf118-like n=1 Tax=Denticeps clupeoides TaxID=299321 RepID=UPI0010A33CB7|nr:uncharacterized protein C6orf118 homolog [Denticeps clupeoides]
MHSSQPLHKECKKLIYGIEKAHKADIQMYFSGHLSPHCLTKAKSQRNAKTSTWEASVFQEKDKDLMGPSIRNKHHHRVAGVEKMTSSLADFTLSATLREPTGFSLGEGAERKLHFHENVEKQHRSEKARQVKPHHPVPNHMNQSRYCQTGPVWKDEQKRMMRFEKTVTKMQSPKEMHCLRARALEKKLQQELLKLPDQTWPSRDRLGVFSDVFDDVCDGGSAHGNFLREIKTEYDSYLKAILTHQSFLQDVMSDGVAGDVELEKALSKKARTTLEENDRVRDERDEYLNAQDVISGIPAGDDVESAHAEDGVSSIESKRHQVWNIWTEIQSMKVEIKEKMVPATIISATEACIRGLNAEVTQLLVANEQLENSNKEMESSISTALNRLIGSSEGKVEIWKKILDSLEQK